MLLLSDLLVSNFWSSLCSRYKVELCDFPLGEKIELIHCSIADMLDLFSRKISSIDFSADGFACIYLVK